MGSRDPQDGCVGCRTRHEPDELHSAYRGHWRSLDQLQAEQIRLFRTAWATAGHPFEPRVSVSRSVFPLVSDEDHKYFGLRGQASSGDQVGYLDGGMARFGRSYIGEPDVVAAELAKDEAVQEADTLLLTIPNGLGVRYNTDLLENIARHVAPAIGWTPAT